MQPTWEKIVVESKRSGQSVVKANTYIVAHANTQMIHGSYRQVYMPKQAVPHLGPDLNTCHDQTFMERYETVLGR